MPEDAYDEDVPMELLWKDLRASPLWTTIERKLLDKRDKMVARMVSYQPKSTDDPGMAYAKHQRELGYIEAMNAIVREPIEAETKAAAKARETK